MVRLVSGEVFNYASKSIHQLKKEIEITVFFVKYLVK